MVSTRGWFALLSIFLLSTPLLRAQERSSSRFITEQEIERARPNVANAFDAVRSLRPQWFRKRGELVRPGMAGGGGQVRGEPRVYLNDRDVGDVDYLKTIPAESIHSLRWLSTTEAGARFGPSLGPGIVVTLRGP